jgi:hypothetical protein
MNSGKTLSIVANGTLSQQVEEGAKVNLQVKYGLIRLIHQETDLCDQVKNVDLECPLEKGDRDITKDVDIPKQVPPVCVHFITISTVSRVLFSPQLCHSVLHLSDEPEI